MCVTKERYDECARPDQRGALFGKLTLFALLFLRIRSNSASNPVRLHSVEGQSNTSAQQSNETTKDITGATNITTAYIEVLRLAE